MKRFKYLVKEYYLSSFPSSYELTSYGKDGWELVETVKGIKKVAFIFKKEYNE